MEPPQNISETTVDNDELITINIERFKKLELLEKNLPEMIENAINEHERFRIKAPPVHKFL